MLKLGRHVSKSLKVEVQPSLAFTQFSGGLRVKYRASPREIRARPLLLTRLRPWHIEMLALRRSASAVSLTHQLSWALM
jgi:hypothetical protein